MEPDYERLRKVLWEQFDKAVERQPKYEDYSNAGQSTPSNFSIAGRTSIAELARAIIEVEREIRDKDGRNMTFKIK
jgi:hypothetical protein